MQQHFYGGSASFLQNVVHNNRKSLSGSQAWELRMPFNKTDDREFGIMKPLQVI